MKNRILILIIFFVTTSFLLKVDKSKIVLFSNISVKYISSENMSEYLSTFNDSLTQNIKNFQLELINGSKRVDLMKKTQFNVCKLTKSTRLELMINNNKYVINDIVKYVCDESIVDLKILIDTLSLNNNFLFIGNFKGNDLMCRSKVINDTIKKFNLLDINNYPKYLYGVSLNGEKMSYHKFFRKLKCKNTRNKVVMHGLYYLRK